MEFSKIDEPIAVRNLMLGSESILVIIGKPALFDDEQDYCCPYSIEFIGKRRTSYAVGMDAVQALQLAMKKIRSDLDFIAKSYGGSISWLPDTPGDTGFPE